MFKEVNIEKYVTQTFPYKWNGLWEIVSWHMSDENTFTHNTNCKVSVHVDTYAR